MCRIGICYTALRTIVFIVSRADRQIGGLTIRTLLVAEPVKPTANLRLLVALELIGFRWPWPRAVVGFRGGILCLAVLQGLGKSVCHVSRRPCRSTNADQDF